MHAREVVLIDVVVLRRYSTGGVALVLAVGRSTRASCEAMGSLGSGATPTLGAALSEGMVGDTMVWRSRIAACRAMASCAIAGMVPSSACRTLHAVKMVTLSGSAWHSGWGRGATCRQYNIVM